MSYEVRFWIWFVPSSLFFWETPKDEEEWRLASICGVFYVLSFFLIKFGLPEAILLKIAFVTVAFFFFSFGYILEKVGYQIMKIGDPFSEPDGSED